jgi:galactokinase
VFPCAISLGTYAAISLRDDDIVNLYSANFKENGIISFSLSEELIKTNEWADYVKGVISEMKKDGHKITKGFNAYIYGNLPNGASLSSSASLELLFSEIIREINNLDLTDLELVKYSQRAENNFVGLHCGIMDQFAIGMSKENHAILLDCATLKYDYAPLELGDNVILIMNTNKRRDLVTSKYNERCAECAMGLSLIKNNYKQVTHLCELEETDLKEINKFITDDVIYRRVRHVVSEMDRVKKTFKALQANDIVTVGKYLNLSHKSLKEDYEVTGIELDTIVRLAQAEEGVLGARMIGAGFAGCAIAIVRKDAVRRVTKNVLDGYLKEIGYEADIYVAKSNNRTTKI